MNFISSNKQVKLRSCRHQDTCKNIYQHMQQKGFTLIEMMVSVSIFLIVMVIALGALLSIIDGNKKTQAINSVSNNLSAAIESFTRDIKTGYMYRCVPRETNVESVDDLKLMSYVYCNEGSAMAEGMRLTFVSTITGTPRVVQYWLEQNLGTDTKSIYKRFCPAQFELESDCAGQYQTTALTSPEINMLAMDIYGKTSDAKTGQPGILIFLRGTAATNKTQVSDFSIQTYISQRLFNI